MLVHADDSRHDRVASQVESRRSLGWRLIGAGRYGRNLATLDQNVLIRDARGSGSIDDLDVFKEGADMMDDAVWELLETLRNRKNEFFEGCITDKARELFGPKKEY